MSDYIYYFEEHITVWHLTFHCLQYALGAWKLCFQPYLFCHVFSCISLLFKNKQKRNKLKEKIKILSCYGCHSHKSLFTKLHLGDLGLSLFMGGSYWLFVQTQLYVSRTYQEWLLPSCPLFVFFLSHAMLHCNRHAQILPDLPLLELTQACSVWCVVQVGVLWGLQLWQPDGWWEPAGKRESLWLLGTQ